MSIQDILKILGIIMAMSGGIIVSLHGSDYYLIITVLGVILFLIAKMTDYLKRAPLRALFFMNKNYGPSSAVLF
ncbi:hypothetical protein SAMN05518684_10213 [Salipaludibacillus aurantiacus]|uniref:Uncharacterized protein n=1 Tax=Salipaludibacillus aurantiacus TaxID=1601833 RepID=A0A1H9Q255_9BACI|nr:hypothetical protein SAMN05518684_10213 [Salipaludibacillus aurantiacus]